MKVHFTLTSPKAKESTAVKMRFSYKKNYWYGTGLPVNPIHWDSEKQRALAGGDLHRKYRRADPNLNNHNTALNAKLESLTATVNNYVDRCRANNTPFSFEELRPELEAITKPNVISPKGLKRPDDEKEDLDFATNYIRAFIRGVETGEITTARNKRYAASTVRSYHGFMSFWIQFEKDTRHKVRFSDIDLTFYRHFIAYCNRRNLRYNYIGKIVRQLKTVMNQAYKEGYHNNLTYKDEDFKTLKTDVDEVYLTEAEVSRIRDLDLTDDPGMSLHRDVFLIGCYTALRFSDVKRIQSTDIKYSPETENYTLEIITQKTKEKVYIPIRPELMEILRRYDLNIPQVHEQHVNKDIKEIARAAGVKGTISRAEIIGGMETMKDVERWKMVKTHTARRTAATLMYLAGIPTLDIMKITGHKSEKTFLNYIKITNKQNADRLRDNPFFRGNSLKQVK